jgi:predicted methyltransferase
MSTPRRRPSLPRAALAVLLAALPVAACGRHSAPAVPVTPDGPAALAPTPSPAPPRTPANVIPFHGGAEWLERPGREEEERPDVVLRAMDLRPGLTVAEIGAGTGFFTRRIAPVVAPGKVYAVDIQAEMLDVLRATAARDELTNIVPVLGTEVDPKLPAGTVDRMLLVDVYHEFQQPVPMLERLRASLAPDGRVILVEYRAEDDSAAHIHADHRMSVAQVLAEWQPAGFRLISRSEELPAQHLFVFGVSQAPGGRR